jgi:hypothetical protein
MTESRLKSIWSWYSGKGHAVRILLGASILLAAFLLLYISARAMQYRRFASVGTQMLIPEDAQGYVHLLEFERTFSSWEQTSFWDSVRSGPARDLLDEFLEILGPIDGRTLSMHRIEQQLEDADTAGATRDRIFQLIGKDLACGLRAEGNAIEVIAVTRLGFGEFMLFPFIRAFGGGVTTSLTAEEVRGITVFTLDQGSIPIHAVFHGPFVFLSNNTDLLVDSVALTQRPVDRPASSGGVAIELDLAALQSAGNPDIDLLTHDVNEWLALASPPLSLTQWDSILIEPSLDANTFSVAFSGTCRDAVGQSGSGALSLTAPLWPGAPITFGGTIDLEKSFNVVLNTTRDLARNRKLMQDNPDLEMLTRFVESLQRDGFNRKVLGHLEDRVAVSIGSITTRDLIDGSELGTPVLVAVAPSRKGEQAIQALMEMIRKIAIAEFNYDPAQKNLFEDASRNGISVTRVNPDAVPIWKGRLAPAFAAANGVFIATSHDDIIDSVVDRLSGNGGSPVRGSIHCRGTDITRDVARVAPFLASYEVDLLQQRDGMQVRARLERENPRVGGESSEEYDARIGNLWNRYFEQLNDEKVDAINDDWSR